MTASSLSFRFRLSAGALAALMLLSTLEVRAQDGAATDGSVQLKYRRAIQAFERKQWEESRRLLLELWDVAPSYDVAISLVQVEYQLERRAAAARYLAFALDHAPPTESLSNLAQYRKNLGELEQVIGSAHIEVTESGAELYVDGELVGRSPMKTKVYLEVGKHTIEARLGTDVATRIIDVVAGSGQDVLLELPRAPEPVAATPPAPRAPSFTTPIVRDDAAPSEKSPLPALVGGTLAAAGIGMFVGFRVSASSDDDRIRRLSSEHGSSGCSDPTNRPAACHEQREALESYDRKRDWSTAGAVVATSAILATVGYYVFWPTKESSRATGRASRPELAASLGGDAAALFVHGSF